MTAQPGATPGDDRPAGQFLRPLRDVAALVAVAAPAVMLFVAVLRLIPSTVGEQFASRTQDSFYSFVNVPIVALPLIAVLLATLIKPVHRQARLITLVAAVEYTVAAVFGVVFGILVGLVQIADFSVRVAFEELLIRVTWLAIFGVAAFAVFQLWRNLYHVPRADTPPGMYGRPANGGQPFGPQGQQYGPPPYGQQYGPAHQYGPQQPGPQQPGPHQFGPVHPGQGAAYSAAPTWGQPPTPAQPMSMQPTSAQPMSAQPGPGQPLSAQPGQAQPLSAQPGQPGQPGTSRPDQPVATPAWSRATPPAGQPVSPSGPAGAPPGPFAPVPGHPPAPPATYGPASAAYGPAPEYRPGGFGGVPSDAYSDPTEVVPRPQSTDDQTRPLEGDRPADDEQRRP